MPRVALGATAARAALIIVSALAIAGCDGSERAEPILAPSASEPATTGSAGGSPAVKSFVPLPDDVKVIVHWEPAGDPDTDAIVNAVVNAQRARWAVMAAGDLDAVAYRDYVTANGKRVIFDEFAAQFIADGVGVTGTDQLFDIKVSDVTATSARVTFCDDQLELVPTDQKSGRILPNTPNPAGGFRVTQTIKQSGDRWKVDTSSAQGGVPECRVDR